jgi:OmcA/MtrC family decaheme c-type cytochrome
MVRIRGLFLFAAICAAASGCGDDAGRDDSCSVRESDAGVVITCSDGTAGAIPRAGGTLLPDGALAPSACTVTRSGSSAVIQCGNAPPVTVPVVASDLDGGAVDGGVRACSVSQESSGIKISCPDGTSATIPADTLPPLTSLAVIGATTASCGTCHDSDRARAHFAVMTVQDMQGLPVETCGTCHNETSIEPVSKSHARPEYEAPGLRLQLGPPSIDPTARKATVRLTLTEAAGSSPAPIPNRTGMSISFVIAKAEPLQSASGATVAGPYRSLISRTALQQNTPAYPVLDGGAPPRSVIQPAAENSTTGKFVEVGAVGSGVWDYTFNYALPADYDVSATYAIAAYATRTVGTVRYVANAERFFVPGNSAAQPAPRDIVKTETCNGCHNPLQAHGGSRQDVQLCLTCHTQGAIDPESGNSIDFNVMIHRIHMGKELPSVKGGRPYSIVGNSLSVHDWSHAGFPQPIANCQVCHTATDSDRWITNGTREACVSCHDNIEQPGAHPIPVQPTTRCGNAVCHARNPEAVARDALEAHLLPLNTASAPIFDIALSSVTATADTAPVVRFSAYVGARGTGAGPRDAGAALGSAVTNIASLSLLEVFINGPNSGFTLSGNNLVRIPKDQLVGLTPVAGAPGEFTFALPKTLRELFALPVAGDDEVDLAQQSYTLSLRAQFDPTPGVAPDSDRVDMQRNPSLAFSPIGSAGRRAAIVSTENCNKCHGELTAHGGANLAKNVEQCAMCHTGALDTRVRQAANGVAGPTTSLRFATLIHRLHGGAIASAPYRVFGFAAAAPYPVLDFSELGFPGDPKVCTTCHLPGTYFLPLPEGDPPTRTVSLAADGGLRGP